MKYKRPDTFTDEQYNATITKDNNIIVSAGAGSGKTTVLKDRVLRILLDDYFEDGRKVHVNNLIILTFTKNSANEMKERIRKIINENNLTEEAELLEASYISTFDSYASSLVKKYNYLLDIEKNFTVMDDALLHITTDKIIDEILERMYENPTPEFTSLINNFTIKDDTNIRSYIKEIYEGLTKVLDRKSFIDNYIEEKYSDKFINEYFNNYMDDFFKMKDDFLDLFDLLCDETEDPETVIENNNIINDFRNASSYDELVQTIKFSLKRATGSTYTEQGKKYKEQLSSIQKKMSTKLYGDETFLIDKYKSTKNDAEVIINIIKELDDRLTLFKKSVNAYTFQDIALKAIQLVSDHKDVADEIRHNTYEIMIDEYQDTNDIQEEFVKHISNNNVYMVGDIKQSIYRFRNANPYIFKNKYDSYIDESKGIRIDLNKNFRSRNEVVNNINHIFDEIMLDSVGGADYKKEHEMIFGNTKFNEVKDDKQDYNMQIYSYDIDKIGTYTKDEVEAFIIANDILDKFNKRTLVFENKKLRPVEYRDFCILVDKGKNFDLLKKVLEYHGIPVAIDKSTSIKEDDEVLLLKNVITLLICIKNNIFDNSFKHSYLSVARSYIYKMNDKDLFNIFLDNSYKDTDLYKLCLKITNQIDSLSNKELLELVVNKFDIINKLETVGDINERLTRLEYFINNAKSLNDYGLDLYSLADYFTTVLDSKEKVEMNRSKAKTNSVKVMTMHGSKGLEFNYVYLPYLDSDYLKASVVKNWSFDKDCGIITPFYDNGIGGTFIRNLISTKEKLETISEKIRLFYVALTRPIEQFTMITYHSEKDKEVDNVINYSNLSETRSYRGLLRLLENKTSQYYKDVSIASLNLSRDYNLTMKSDFKEAIKNTKDLIKIKSVKINSNLLENKHFSKSLKKVLDKEFKERLDFGTYMHYCFEVYDFQNDNLNELNIPDKYKDNIRKFLEHPEVRNIKNAKTYKEHEIKFNKDGYTFHGFIDLLVEYDDHFDIIDYKLSNINSDDYVKQLTGYKEYIESKYKKNADMYLYSIKHNEFKKL